MNAEAGFLRTGRKILLATDLSCRCDRALGRAALLSKRWHASLTALHVVEHAPGLDEETCTSDLPSWRQCAGRADMAERQLRADVLEHVPWAGVMVTTGDPGTAILGIAGQHEVDVVVTGVTRTEAFGGLLSGATVGSLIRNAVAPVLIVKNKPRREYRSIVVATDYSEASRQVLATTLRLFPDSRVILFHAFRIPGRSVPRNRHSIAQLRGGVEQEAKAFLLDCALTLKSDLTRVELVIEHGELERLLRDYVHARGVDLVVSGTHGRAAIMDAFIGSGAKRLLDAVPCDVMTVLQRRAAPAET